MQIYNKLLDELTAQAKVTPRLRQSYDIRAMPEDNSRVC